MRTVLRNFFFVAIIIVLSLSTFANAYGADVYVKDIHYYAQSLERFMGEKFEGENPESKVAVLVDMDNDGTNEMITFYATKDDGAGSIDYYFCIYDIEKENYIKSEYITSSGYDVSTPGGIRISEKNYLVLEKYDLGYSYEIIEYKNGKLKTKDVIFEHFDLDGTCGTRDEDGYLVYLSKTEFSRLWDSYGIKNYIKKINPEESEMNEILQMTTRSVGTEIDVIFGDVILDLNLPIINVNNRTFYPVRELIEAIGGTVGWDERTRTITASLDNKKVEFQIGNSSYEANAQRKTMEKGIVPFIEEGRTYIPIRYLVEGFGYQVEWSEVLSRIKIQ